MDYDLGVDPFTADRAQFREAIGKISQLPNLEMNFRRGDSLLDMVSNVPIRVDSNVVSRYRDHVGKIQKLGHDLHRARKAERKKNLRLDILGRRFDLTGNVLTDELKSFQTEDANLTATLFGDLSRSEKERRKEIAHEIGQLQQALDKLQADRKELGKLASRAMASDFYYKLRRLEGADFDSPFNFAWRIDFPTILAESKSTLAGEMNLVNQAQKQQELTGKQSSVTGGFDIVVGNPPFVTARVKEKRGLYFERWPRVCVKNYQLVCPFFELAFGLLSPGSQLGFIVSNAFAKREFGKPLVEDFFPTVDLQKVVDCSGLMFPGHGTPTCIVFGRNTAPESKSPVRVTTTLPGGGDLRTPPEESPLWHTIADHNDHPGFSDDRIAVTSHTHTEMGHWPWNFLSDSTASESAAPSDGTKLSDLCDEPIGAQFITGKDDAYVLPPHFVRRLEIPNRFVKAYATGEDIRDWTILSTELILFPYEDNLLPLKEPLPTSIRCHLQPFKADLENVVISGSIKKKETNLKWFEYRRLARAKFRQPLNVLTPQIATHAHFLVADHIFAFKEKAPAMVLKDGYGEKAVMLLAGLLNSGVALYWLKQICFSKRESAEAATDTYYEFSGGQLEQFVLPLLISESLRGKSNGLAERLTALSQACWERGRQMPSLSLKKLFEKDGEAYHGWNASLPGHVAPHKDIAASFTTAAELRQRYERAQSIRETLRAEMITLQEEMDWLVYAAYGLLAEDSPAVGGPRSVVAAGKESDATERVPPLQREHRPFVLWQQAGGDFDKAVALIPVDWPKDRKALWQARLAAIRDNEHIRRIEQPVRLRCQFVML